jgi:hypothetical protein
MDEKYRRKDGELIVGINLAIQEVKEKIAKDINESKLPPGILLMIINEFLSQIQMQNLRAIEAEKKASEEKESEN